MKQTSLIVECSSLSIIRGSFHFESDIVLNSPKYRERPAATPTFTFSWDISRQEQVGVLTPRENVHIYEPRSFPQPGFLGRWKVPNPSLDELIFSGPLCSFTVTDWKPRGSPGRTKIKGELKRKTELNFSICITYPILHLSIRTIQFVFPPLMPCFPSLFKLLH